MDERIRELCRLASVEYDTAKLIALTTEISRLMLEVENKRDDAGRTPEAEVGD
jgi:hypothetical protein